MTQAALAAVMRVRAGEPRALPKVIPATIGGCTFFVIGSSTRKVSGDLWKRRNLSKLALTRWK
jgi:hypothetical protein